MSILIFCDSWTQTQTGNGADSHPKAKKQQKKQPSNVTLLTEQTNRRSSFIQ